MAGVESKTKSAGLLNSDVLRKSSEASGQIREELDSLLTSKIGKYATEDTSLVVFGSLARGEWTTGSDLDWTYLIDGEANSDHLVIAQNIQKIIPSEVPLILESRVEESEINEEVQNVLNALSAEGLLSVAGD